MDVKEKLVGLINDVLKHLPWGQISSHTAGEVADYLIKNGVTVQEPKVVEIDQVKKWIPASEPPKDTCEYWIACKSGGDYFYSTGYYDGKHWYSSVTHNKIPVAYWMPLPELPKGEMND